MTWATIIRPDGVHVLPEYERAHWLVDSCLCGTKVEVVGPEEGQRLIVHRDVAERAGLGPDTWRLAS